MSVKPINFAASVTAVFFGTTLLTGQLVLADANHLTISATSATARSAQRTITNVVAELQRNFESSPALRDARANVQNASNAYQSACNAAKVRVATSPAYRENAERVVEAERSFAALQSDDQATSAQIRAAANNLLQLRIVVSKLESDALTANADVAAAHDAWIDANAKLLDAQRTFNASIQANPDYRAAKSRLDNAWRQLSH